MFNPHFQIDGILPNVHIVSADSVIFHVHQQRLLAASTNAFGGSLAYPPRLIAVSENSSVLNIVLHVIYGMSCLRFQPPFESTEAAVAALIKYGVPAASLANSQSLHELFMFHAPHRPIEVFALAGHYALEPVAVAVSAHLLAYDLTRISDTLVVKMGSVYFNRLYKLQQTRLTALRDILLRRPPTHAPTATCADGGQEEIGRAWAFATAQIVWTALPNVANLCAGTSIQALQSVFEQAGATINCLDCRTMHNSRIAQISQEWAAVKRTI
ncbi:hypothetical protein VTO73DRAFT_1671 [Trametes versicolor]